MNKQITIEAIKGEGCLQCDFVMYNEFVDFGCKRLSMFMGDMDLPDCKHGYIYKVGKSMDINKEILSAVIEICKPGFVSAVDWDNAMDVIKKAKGER